MSAFSFASLLLQRAVKLIEESWVERLSALHKFKICSLCRQTHLKFRDSFFLVLSRSYHKGVIYFSKISVMSHIVYIFEFKTFL